MLAMVAIDRLAGPDRAAVERAAAQRKKPPLRYAVGVAVEAAPLRRDPPGVQGRSGVDKDRNAWPQHGKDLFDFLIVDGDAARGPVGAL